MSDLECFSCDKRQLCEPIIADAVVDLVATSMNEGANTANINPMDAISLMKILSDVATTGDTTILEESEGKFNFDDFPEVNADPMTEGYAKLREAGCSLDDVSFGIRLLQYANGNMFTIAQRAMEEGLVQQLDKQVDGIDTDDARLKSILGSAGLELSSMLEEMDSFTVENPELSDPLNGAKTQISRILNGINQNLGNEEVENIRKPAKSLEELKLEERTRYIEQNGWDEANLDFSQKLELKAHLKQMGLIR
jgi:hypothetical protein